MYLQSVKGTKATTIFCVGDLPSNAKGSTSFLSLFLSSVVKGRMSFNKRDGVVSSLPIQALLIAEGIDTVRASYPLSWRQQSVAAQQVVILSLLDAMVLVSASLSPVRSSPQDRTHARPKLSG